MSDTIKEKHDILEDIKQVEREIKKACLVKVIEKLKENALAIAKLKAHTKLVLKEMGIDEGDAKRVIDFVNELPDAKMKKQDEEAVLEEAREFVKKKKEDASSSIKFNPTAEFDQTRYKGMIKANPYFDPFNTTGDHITPNDYYTVMSSDNAVTLTSADNKSLELKL